MLSPTSTTTEQESVMNEINVCNSIDNESGFSDLRPSSGSELLSPILSNSLSPFRINSPSTISPLSSSSSSSPNNEKNGISWQRIWEKRRSNMLTLRVPRQGRTPTTPSPSITFSPSDGDIGYLSTPIGSGPIFPSDGPIDVMKPIDEKSFDGPVPFSLSSSVSLSDQQPQYETQMACPLYSPTTPDGKKLDLWDSINFTTSKSIFQPPSPASSILDRKDVKDLFPDHVHAKCEPGDQDVGVPPLLPGASDVTFLESNSMNELFNSTSITRSNSHDFNNNIGGEYNSSPLLRTSPLKTFDDPLLGHRDINLKRDFRDAIRDVVRNAEALEPRLLITPKITPAQFSVGQVVEAAQRAAAAATGTVAAAARAKAHSTRRASGGGGGSDSSSLKWKIQNNEDEGIGGSSVAGSAAGDLGSSSGGSGSRGSGPAVGLGGGPTDQGNTVSEGGSPDLSEDDDVPSRRDDDEEWRPDFDKYLDKAGAGLAGRNFPTGRSIQSMQKKKFVCPQCHKGFTQKGGLSNHLRIHTGERPFQCSECQRRFTQKCNLTRHMRIHTGEKPYACGACGKRFNRRWGLMVHAKTHTKEREELANHKVFIS